MECITEATSCPAWAQIREEEGREIDLQPQTYNPSTGPCFEVSCLGFSSGCYFIILQTWASHINSPRLCFIV